MVDLLSYYYYRAYGSDFSWSYIFSGWMGL